MAEQDAFGREQGEDPLAAMGWSDAPAAPVEAQPVPTGPGALTEAAPAGPPSAPPSASVSAPAPAPARRHRAATIHVRRRSATLGCLPTLLFFGAVITIVVAVVVPFISGVVESIDEIETPRIEGPPGSGPGEPGRPGAAPRNLQPRSMLVRRNLAPTLRKLRGQMGGRLHYVRIEAQRVDLQVAKRGRLVSAQARWDREPDVFSPVVAPASSTFAWSRVDPSAPARFVRAALRQGGRRAVFGYAVLVNAAGLQWQVFLADGTHFTASLDGRRVNRV